MSFESALGFVLGWEGGYVNDPDDRGGPTNHGVTQRTFNYYRNKKGLPPKSVKKITVGEVKDLYRTQYWNRVKGDKLPESLALTVFDFAVNSGPVRAIKHMQTCLKVTADGAIGPKTLDAVNKTKDIYHLCNCIIDRREYFLRSIATGKRAKFLNGWLNRINALRKEI